MKSNTKYIVKPERICLELTNYCDLTCVFCDRERLKKEGMWLDNMSDELLTKILQDMEKAYSRFSKLDTLVLVGLGEPLLTKHLEQRLKTISQHAHVFRNLELTSNGVSLTPGKSAVLLNSAINYFIFSVNFTDRDTYAQMMGRDSFDKVIENVRSFLKLKRQANNTALVSIQVFADKDMSETQLETMKSFFPDAVKDPRVIFHVQPIYNKPSVQENIEDLTILPIEKRRYPCWSMYSIVYIDVEGYVYPCTIGNDCYRKQSSLNVGNVSQKGLIEIFNDEAICTARKRAESGELPFPECRECNIWALMPNMFTYDKDRGKWKKGWAGQIIFKIKNCVHYASTRLPLPVQNMFRKIYAVIFNAYNKKVN